MVELVKGVGIASEFAYFGGLASIGVSIAAWSASSGTRQASQDKAERLGMFAGLWSPTFMQAGTAIKP